MNQTGNAFKEKSFSGLLFFAILQFSIYLDNFDKVGMFVAFIIEKKKGR